MILKKISIFKLSPKEIVWWPTLKSDILHINNIKEISKQNRFTLLQQYAVENPDRYFRTNWVCSFVCITANLRRPTYDIDDEIFARCLHRLKVPIFFDPNWARAFIRESEIAEAHRICSLALRLGLDKTFILLSDKNDQP